MEGKANATPMGIPMETPIDQIGLDRRTCKVLLDAGIETAGELARMSKDDLSKVRGMGRRSFDEIMRWKREAGGENT
jgi:DNA-directed RNA polymerase alpha subunit